MSSFRGAEHHDAGSITVKGHRYQVFVDDLGQWLAYHSGNEVKADSKAGLTSKLRKIHQAAKVSVAIPFVTVGRAYAGRTFARKGVATGLHSGNGNALVRYEDGAGSEQLRDYGNHILTGDTDPQEWLALAKASAAAAQALQDFEKEHVLDLNKAVREAVDAALKGDEQEAGP